MPLDSLLKKYFVAVVLALIALAAYFQAAGLSQLVGSALTLAPQPMVAKPGGATLPAIERPRAQAIIDRNPFDSVTGPLNAKPVEETSVAAKPIDVSDPLSVPRCEGVNVRILTESDDPMWSFAAVQGPGETAPVLRRVGDTIGDKKVAYIGFNPVEASPAIWLEGPSQLCQALLFATTPPPPAATPAAAPTAEAQPAAKADSRTVDPEIKSKIHKISDTEFQIDRAAVDKILENQGDLMKSARIVPEQKDGKVVGVRLFGVRPDTLLGTLGLQNGDRLEQINGFDMGSPEKALEAYARLRTAGNLSVTLNRRGQPMTIQMKIQ